MQCKHDIHIMANMNELAQTAADDFVARAIKTVEKRGVFSVVLSGGTTPVGMFEKLAEKKGNGKNAVPWERIHFFWGDEHFVAPDDPASNFRIANYHLLSKITVTREHVHPILTDTVNAHAAAQAYEKQLREIFMLEEGELPIFDLVFLGLGPHGETASFQPNSEIVNSYADMSQTSKRIVEAVDRGKEEVSTISMTPPVFNSAHQVTFLVSGKAKAEAFDKVVNGLCDPQSCPAKLIKPREGSILWLVDKNVVS